MLVFVFRFLGRQDIIQPVGGTHRQFVANKWFGMVFNVHVSVLFTFRQPGSNTASGQDAPTIPSKQMFLGVVLNVFVFVFKPPPAANKVS